MPHNRVSFPSMCLPLMGTLHGRAREGAWVYGRNAGKSRWETVERRSNVGAAWRPVSAAIVRRAILHSDANIVGDSHGSRFPDHGDRFLFSLSLLASSSSSHALTRMTLRVTPIDRIEMQNREKRIRSKSWILKYISRSSRTVSARMKMITITVTTQPQTRYLSRKVFHNCHTEIPLDPGADLVRWPGCLGSPQHNHTPH